jgi:hypothetical protein
MSEHSPQKWFNLEEHFFKHVDQQLLERLKDQQQLEKSAASIMQVTGITDHHLAEEIARLNVSVETLAAFRLVPLVAVAWADDRVDSSERFEITKAAEQAGIRGDDPAMAMLNAWTEQRPGPELLDAWCDYTHALCASINGEQRTALKREVMRQVRAVAEATGGVLGFGSISPSERSTMKRIEEALS